MALYYKSLARPTQGFLTSDLGWNGCKSISISSEGTLAESLYLGNQPELVVSV